VPIKYKEDDAFDPLNDLSCFPTLCQLQAKNGSIRHGVTICGKFVFDSNVKKVLPLTRASLDWCCSTNEDKSTFKSVFHAVWFTHNKPRSEWRIYL
jgi:hypothetical protein